MLSESRFFQGVFQATISLSPTWNFPDTVLKKGLLRILKMEDLKEFLVLSVVVGRIISLSSIPKPYVI